jgi:hypothetical protein
MLLDPESIGPVDVAQFVFADASGTTWDVWANPVWSAPAE